MGKLAKEKQNWQNTDKPNFTTKKTGKLKKKTGKKLASLIAKKGKENAKSDKKLAKKCKTENQQ